ncbi:MAG TPA: FAD-dependent oxidoreductase [Conexibacter sp.]|nr:FAD-dependent oxidoreductase [Conexibacter sp.]
MRRLETDVAIVGGGLAGLTTARELERLGIATVVLEARDRVGGRVLSRQVGDGVAIDQGGQFVGPPREGPWLMEELCHTLGIERFRTHEGGDKLMLLGSRRKRYRGLAPSWPPHAAIDLVRAKDALERLARTFPAGEPWRARDAAVLDGQTYASWIDGNVRTRQSRALLRVATETLYAAEPEELSLLHALAYVRSAGRGHLTHLARVGRGHQQEQLRGGAQSVPLALAAALGERVVLESPVRQIAVRGDSVTVSGPQLRVSCRRVVVALPPALAGRLDIEPPLPGSRDRAALAFTGGSVITASLVYAEPFWRAQGLSGYAATTHGPVRGVLDVSPPPPVRAGVLQAFVVASSARALARVSAGERRRAILGGLAELFGDAARTPEQYFEKDWTADEWTRGCYHGIGAPRDWLAHGPRLREAVGPIHWAGSETATWGLGTMEGAIDSGRRAAREVVAELRLAHAHARTTEAA